MAEFLKTRRGLEAAMVQMMDLALHGAHRRSLHPIIQRVQRAARRVILAGGPDFQGEGFLDVLERCGLEDTDMASEVLGMKLLPAEFFAPLDPHGRLMFIGQATCRVCVEEAGGSIPDDWNEGRESDDSYDLCGVHRAAEEAYYLSLDDDMDCDRPH